MSNVSTKEIKVNKISQQQIDDIKNMTSFDEIQKMEQILVNELMDDLYDQRKEYNKKKAESITEAGRKYMKEVFEKMPDYFTNRLWGYSPVDGWTFTNDDMTREHNWTKSTQTKGKQIFSDIDPYGEESWEDDK